MGADPGTGLILGGASLAGSALSGFAASEQNDALYRSMRSANQAASAQMRQAARAEAIERSERLRQAEQIRGRIRVAIGEGGTQMALLRQADTDVARANAVGRGNLAIQNQSILSSLYATQQGLQARTQNTMLAAGTGAIQGLTTGLSILGAFDAFAGSADARQRLEGVR